MTTNGSVGKVTGTVKITVRNEGPGVTDASSMDFHLDQNTTTAGGAWSQCRPDSSDSKLVRCSAPGLKAGASFNYTMQFSIDLDGGKPFDSSVTVHPTDRNDPDEDNNAAALKICTNGCG